MLAKVNTYAMVTINMSLTVYNSQMSVDRAFVTLTKLLAFHNDLIIKIKDYKKIIGNLLEPIDYFDGALTKSMPINFLFFLPVEKTGLIQTKYQSMFTDWCKYLADLVKTMDYQLWHTNTVGSIIETIFLKNYLKIEV